MARTIRYYLTPIVDGDPSPAVNEAQGRVTSLRLGTRLCISRVVAESTEHDKLIASAVCTPINLSDDPSTWPVAIKSELAIDGEVITADTVLNFIRECFSKRGYNFDALPRGDENTLDER